MSKGQVKERSIGTQEPKLGWLGSIRGRLFIGLAACGLVPVAVIALTNQTMIATSIRDSEYEQITELTKEVARQIAESEQSLLDVTVMRSVQDAIDDCISRER